jgi:regulator of replication initiation timing
MINIHSTGAKPQGLLVFKIPQILADVAQSYVDQGSLIIIKVGAHISDLLCEYERTSNDLLRARSALVRLEKDLKAIQYKYSALEFDNEELSKQTSNEPDQAKEESKKSKHDGCNFCKTFATIKEDLKLLKAENHDRISKLQYENEISTQKLNELRSNIQKLKEENFCLKEENRLLRTNSYADSHQAMCAIIDYIN